MPQQRIVLRFTNAPDHALEETVGAVLDAFYGDAAFPTAQAQGGTAATADKNNKRGCLIDLLRELASYVQDDSDNDLAKLLSSGFDAVSTNRSSSPLDVPVIKDITNGMTRQLLVKSPPSSTPACEVRYALSPADQAQGAWQKAASSLIRARCRSTASPPAATTPSKPPLSAAAPGIATGATRWGI